MYYRIDVIYFKLGVKKCKKEQGRILKALVLYTHIHTHNTFKNTKNIYNNSGITITTLVITIIIIIILSSVTINVVLGNNGLIKQATQMKDSVEGKILWDNIKANEIYEEYSNVMLEDTEIDIPTITKPVGNIEFTDISWVGDGTATAIIETDNDIDELQYQVNGTSEDSWTTIDNGYKITGLEHNDIVYGRLKNLAGTSEVKSTTIKDTIAPSLTINTSSLTYDSVTVSANASDDQSGLATSGRYTYYLDGVKITSINTAEYTFTGLETQKTYTIKVVVKDKAGLEQSKETTITTLLNPNIISSRLKEGDYVEYIDATGVTRECVVLYGPENANYEDYGIQIITMDTVENISLGSSNFTTATDGYNNAISTLNEATQKYLNTTYAESVRCVGSVPSNPDYDGAGMFTSSYTYMSRYNGRFKNADENYKTDCNQMTNLNILTIGRYYWLTSRTVNSYSTQSGFNIRAVYSTGMTGSYYLFNLYSSNTPKARSYTSGLRPIFTLNNNLIITGGSGVQGDAYKLGT